MAKVGGGTKVRRGDGGAREAGRARYVDTLERALKLVLCFSPERPQWTVSELSRYLGYSKSTVSRILGTLEKLGFADQDPVGGGYRLGLRFFELGNVLASGMDLKRVALPVMTRLVAETGQTTLLTVPSDGQAVCVEKVDSPDPVRVTFQLGRRGPLHAGASGKALLAFMPDEAVERVITAGLRRYTERTITDPEELRSNLAVIRAAGYVVTCGEVDEGVVGVAAPVFDAGGSVVASVTVVGMPPRIERQLETVIQKVKEAAEEISTRLGFRPQGRMHTAPA